MTSDQLRAYLDAHGVDGAPTVPGFYVATALGFRSPDVAQVWAMSDGTLCIRLHDTVAELSNFQDLRHTPLPDFRAMARELEELRAKVEGLGMRARVGCGDCLGTGEGEDATCETCDGDGWVYHRRADWVTP